MMYLEERKLVHRDLAARNVLVGEKISGVPVVKVGDRVIMAYLDSGSLDTWILRLSYKTRH